MGRRVTLVLCRSTGELLGALPPFDVGDSHWQETGPIVLGARERFGVSVVVLRLLRVVDEDVVTYLAETDGSPPIRLAAWTGPDPIADHPLRAAYARPGGPAADVAWADAALAEQGRQRSGPAEQLRTWNLSAIWRLPTSGGPVWLKVVPSFLARESAMVRLVDTGVRPPMLAATAGRVLLDDVPGSDQYGATGPRLVEFARMLIDLQAEWAGRTPTLFAAGAVDWRTPSLLHRVRSAVERNRGGLTDTERQTVDDLVAGLPARLAELESCGIPATLVHGDFHRGNVRGAPGRWAVLDWGEVGVGSPLFDQVVFTDGMDPADRAAVDAEWASRWRLHRPGSEPERAVELMRPVAGLMSTAIYQGFLDAVEPDERVYHREDPGCALRRVVRQLLG